MKLLIGCSALLLVTPSLSLAQGDGGAGTEGWSDFDSDLAALENAEEEGSIQVSGWITTIWADSDTVAPPATSKVNGFFFDSVRVELDGEREDYSWKLSFDGFNGTTNLFDAYVRGPAGDDLTWTLGRFRTPFVRSGLMPENRYLFLAPTRSGLLYRGRSIQTTGGMLTYLHDDRLALQLALQNGFDGTNDQHLITARATASIIGDGVPMIEGAYGAPSSLEAQAAIAISDDSVLPNGQALLAEAAVTHGRFYGAFEIADYDSGYTAADLATGVITIPAQGRGNTSPWALTGSVLIDEASEWEAAVRHEDYDDLLGREVTTIGLNHYLEGHDAKLMFNWLYTSFSGAPSQNLIAIGASVSF
jgi:hypothetical protein